jgi:uncharacterized protein YoxC
MEQNNINIKLIGAAAVGAIGGLLLGSYIWGSKENNQALSTHLSTLSKLLKEIEGIRGEEADELRERINRILDAIESSYVKTEE